MDMINDLMKNMRLGDKKSILEGMEHLGALLRVNAIMIATLYKYKEPEFINKIRKLTTDDITMSCYAVSDFALAALDILGVEHYTGDRYNVKALIDSKFEFYLENLPSGGYIATKEKTDDHSMSDEEFEDYIGKIKEQ